MNLIGTIGLTIGIAVLLISIWLLCGVELGNSWEDDVERSRLEREDEEEEQK